MNFNISILISDEGTIFFEKKKEALSYLFDQNEKITIESKTAIFASYYIWIQRRMQYIIREYIQNPKIFFQMWGGFPDLY